MKAYALTLCLRDDQAKIAAYKLHHRAVWPGVLSALRSAGIQEMKIFTLGTRMFMYIETDDAFEPGTGFAKFQSDPVAREWDDLMATLQERAPEARPGQWWAPMELVFSMQWPQHLPPPA
ncbi:MAG: L-rhamnose mutarotase [Chloroflexota bacterium]